ncbi:Zinc resistance conferring protein [Blastocladiella emersonii ATCC 22665]|nr:Zinc resistance conferring protein [Blastocladiella emersonii ATCC 22665]
MVATTTDAHHHGPTATTTTPLIADSTMTANQSPSQGAVPDITANPTTFARAKAFFTSRQGRISTLLSLTGSFFLVELVVGHISGSLALVADAWHMLSDVLSLVVALYAIRLASRTTFHASFSYGWSRAEIVGALINGVFLLALCLTIVLDAIERFYNPEEIKNPKQVLIVGAIGLGVNILGLFLFHDHGHSHGGHSHGGHSHGDDAHDHDHDHDHDHGHDHASAPATAGGDSKATLAAPAKPSDAVSIRSHQSRAASLRSTVTNGGNNMDSGTITGEGPAYRIVRVGTKVSIDLQAASSSSSSADARSIHHSPATSPVLRARSLSTTSGTARVAADEVAPLPPVPSIPDKVLQAATDAAALQHQERDLEAGLPHGHAHAHDHANETSGDGHSHDLNMRGVFLHVLGDALGSIAVMISAGVALAMMDPVTGEVPRWVVYLDPLVSLAITCLLLAGTVPLVRRASTILLQVAPEGLDLPAIRRKIGEVPGVVGVHELHVWQLDNAKSVATVHIAMLRDAEADYAATAAAIKTLLHTVGIHSTTVQPEFLDDGMSAHCQYRCPDPCAVCCADEKKN